MKQSIGFVRISALTRLATMLLTCFATVLGQQQPPAVSHASTSSEQVTPRKTASPYGNAPNPAVAVKRAAGAITGFVYWQMNVFQPNSTCQGLTVKVVTVSKSGMPLQLLSSSSTLTAMGPVTDNSAPGMPKYMLCSYSFHNMPENVSLRALLYGPPPSTSVVIPSAFQIPSGNCNSTPSSNLSSILTGGEMLCGDNAFNINFKITSKAVAAPRPITPSMLLPHAPGPGGMLSQPQAAPDNATTAAPNTGATLVSAKPGSAAGNASSTETSNGTLLAVGNSANEASTASIPLATGNFVPRMPPLQSNPKRDASPAADAVTKAQIQSKVRAQLDSSRQNTARSGIITQKPQQTDIPEVQALQRQNVFLQSLRTQAGGSAEQLIAARNTKLVVPNVRPSPNPKLVAPAPTKFCPTPQIHTVNGKSAGVVFTQDLLYNDYIISGCGFGSQGGQGYLSGAVTGGRIDLVVKQWSDTQIEAVVEPGLTGVLDGWPDLIVAPTRGPRAKFPNCRFYAQRRSVLLPTIPQQYVTLANVPVGDTTHGFGTKYCPGPDISHLFPCIAFNAGPPLDGITNGHDHRNDPNEVVSNAVDRDGGQLQFNAGEDVYDLSNMAPGFEVDYPTVYWYAWTSDVCEGWASDAFPKKPGDSVGYDTEGHYSWNKKTKTKVVVDWGVDHCGWRWLGMFRVNDWYNSGYSLQVYVNGPIGIDPWTGHPVTTARNFGQAQPSRVVRVP
jgi:hypothetical protein